MKNIKIEAIKNECGMYLDSHDLNIANAEVDFVIEQVIKQCALMIQGMVECRIPASEYADRLLEEWDLI